MESTYLAIEREVIRRRRRLNLLVGVRTGASWGMIATLIYLAAVYLGLLGMISWWLLVAFNLLAIWLGARQGRRRPVPLHEDLYRVDRAFELSERLSTIYELRLRSGSTDFLTALYGRVKNLPAHVAQALPMAKNEQRSWAVLSGLTFASILFLGLWLAGVPTLQLSQLLSGTSTDTNVTAPVPEQQKTRSETIPSAVLEVPSKKDSSDSPQATLAPSESNPTNPPDSTCAEQESPSKLAEEQTSTRQCAAVSTGEPSKPSPKGASANSDDEAQALSDALSNLEKRLEQGEISPEELKDQLQQLAKDTSSQGVQDALQHAAQTKDLQELKESLSKLQQQLEQQAGASDSNQKTGEEDSSMASSNTTPNGQESNSQQEGKSSSTDEKSSDSGAQDQESSGAKSASGEGQSNPKQSGDNPATEASSQSSSESQGSSKQGDESHVDSVQSGGDAPGQEPGAGAQSSSGTSSLPINRNLLIHGANLPRDPTLLDRLLTQGLPVDLAAPQHDGTPILRLNLERVEALLELRNLPPDLRNLVRAYFLAITEDQ